MRHRGWHSLKRRRSNKGNGLGAVLLLALLSVFGKLVEFANQDPGEATALALIPIAGLALGVYLWIRGLLKRRRALRAIDLAKIDHMSGAEFENYMACVFRQPAHGVKHTGGTGDQGCDLILTK